MNIGKDLKFIRISNAEVAGTTDITSSEVDTMGYDGVVFVTAFGTITSGAVTSVKIQQDTATGMASAADLEGTGRTVADDDDNQIVIHDIYRPRERFLRVIVDRATQNAVVDGIVAILYKGLKKPATNDSSTVIGIECHVSPAEGTA